MFPVMTTVLTSTKTFTDLINTPVENESVVSGLEFPLKLLRVLGIFPFSFKRDENGELKLSFRWLSFPTIWVCLLLAGYAVSESGGFGERLIVNAMGSYGALKTLKALCRAAHDFQINFYFAYFNVKCVQFGNLLVECEGLFRQLKFTQPDRKFKQFVIWLSVILLTVAITENTLFFYTLGTTNMRDVGPYEPIQYNADDNNKISILTSLLSYFDCDDYSPFSLLIMSMSITLQAFRAYVWNYIDVFMILLFRLISFQFKALAESAAKLAEDSSNLARKGTTAAVWEEIRSDYEQLHGLLRKLNAFLSPPLLLSYLVNVTVMAMHLSQWIGSKGIKAEHGVPIYASMSSSLLILRTALMTHYGSQLHENAHLILGSLEKCSSTAYSLPLERLERKLAAERIGLWAGGVFFISRSLFASITSVIFTVEIFLLQADQPTQRSSM